MRIEQCGMNRGPKINQKSTENSETEHLTRTTERTAVPANNPARNTESTQWGKSSVRRAEQGFHCREVPVRSGEHALRNTETLIKSVADSARDVEIPAAGGTGPVYKTIESPKTIRQRLRILRLLVGIWSLLTLAWIVLLLAKVIHFSWAMPFVFAAGYMNTALGIFNSRRLLAGKKPW